MGMDTQTFFPVRYLSGYNRCWRCATRTVMNSLVAEVGAEVSVVTLRYLHILLICCDYLIVDVIRGSLLEVFHLDSSFVRGYGKTTLAGRVCIGIV